MASASQILLILNEIDPEAELDAAVKETAEQNKHDPFITNNTPYGATSPQLSFVQRIRSKLLEHISRKTGIDYK